MNRKKGTSPNTGSHRKTIWISSSSSPPPKSKASGLKKKSIPRQVRWMPRLPKGNHVDYWNIKIHPLKALGAVKSRMSHFHWGIRQPFRGYDDRVWNAHFRASRKKIKAKTILHHLTLSPFSPSLAKPHSQILRHLAHLFPAPQWGYILWYGREFQPYQNPPGAHQQRPFLFCTWGQAYHLLLFSKRTCPWVFAKASRSQAGCDHSVLVLTASWVQLHQNLPLLPAFSSPDRERLEGKGARGWLPLFKLITEGTL